MTVRAIPIGMLPILIAGCDRSPPAPAQGSAAVGSASRTAPTIAIDPPAASGAASPNLVASGDGVLATWLEPSDASSKSHRLRLARFANGRWDRAMTIAEGAAIVANWADVPSVARQDDGTLVAHWAEKSAAPEGHAYDVVLARSTDGGGTWRRLGMPHRDGTSTEHGFVSLVPDGDAVLALWLDGRAMASGAAGATALRAARVGTAIGAEQLVDERVCDCCSTSAVTTAEGPAVIYRDRGGDELRDPFLSRRPGGTWSAPRAVNADGWKIAGCPVNGPMMAASGREVVAAWYTYADQRPGVRVAFSGDAGATFDRPLEIDAPRGARVPIGRVDVVIDRPGEALVSWVAAEREDGRLLVRRVARDRRRGPELELAAVAAAREGGFPRMELLGGDVVLVWTDTRASTIRAARLARAEVPAVGADADSGPSTAAPAVPIGDRAPVYRAVSLDGKPVALAELRGAPVLLNVWATWCEPCRHELPALNALRDRFASRGLRVIAASVDRERSREQIAGLARRLGRDLEVWHDPDDRASVAFGVTTLPTTLLFDADGVLAWRRDGAVAAGDHALERAIEGVLRK
jgi:thiol-disulfide isomerase/thioredoxin